MCEDDIDGIMVDVGLDLMRRMMAEPGGLLKRDDPSAESDSGRHECERGYYEEYYLERVMDMGEW